MVGGGLAGMAAAFALATRGFQVTLLEAKRRLGGRAGSYVDRETGERIDHCQHVAMGCCTNYLDFCRATGIDRQFVRYDTLHFFGRDGRRCDFRPSRWLPAPLHLLPAFDGLTFLASGSRSAVKRAILRLTRERTSDSDDAPTMLEWLHSQRQPADAIELFWSVVLVSALGDTLDRVSVSSARKVFVDGFMAARGASDVLVPAVSLGELYDVRAAGRLKELGVDVRLESAISRIATDRGRAVGIVLADERLLPADHVIVAVPWRRALELLTQESGIAVPEMESTAGIKASPITGVHLWFDQPIMELPHAVLVGRLTQWVFARSLGESPSSEGHYYQVVISGSHDLAGRDRAAVLAEVLDDLAAIWPGARKAKLVRSKIITEHESVFSMRPGIDRIRPSQRTEVTGLTLAGDWTQTGWPATMEGAVRSGYLAAEAILAEDGRPERVLVPDLKRGLLARLVLGAG